MIRNILFDLDDTLLDFHRAERAALTDTLVHVGVAPQDHVLARYHAINAEQWRLLEQGKLTRDEVKVRRYRLLFEEIGAACSPEEATRFYEKRLAIGHYFVDGALQLLQQLADHYRMYVVTNGTAYVQENRIRSAGLAAFMQDVFISQYIGFNKPDVRFFDYCFSRIPHFRKEETLIVGDSLTSDIQGGKNAGILTVWFHPSGQKEPGTVAPDYEISRLEALPALLAAL